MDSSTPKRWFYANWIKLFSNLEKKSTSAQYVAKSVQCNIAARRTWKFFEHLLYFNTGRAQSLCFNTGRKYLFLETLNLRVFDFTFLIRIDPRRAKPNYQTPFSGITTDLSNPSAKNCKFLRKFRNTWFCVEWTPPLLKHNFMQFELNYFQFLKKKIDLRPTLEKVCTVYLYGWKRT